MGRWPVYLIFSLCLLQPSVAQNRTKVPSSSRLPSYFKAFQSYDEMNGLVRAVFRNGLTVVVEEHPSTPLVAVTSLIRVETGGGVDSRLVAEFAGRPFIENIAALGGFGEIRSRDGEALFVSVVPAEKVLEALESHTKLLTPRVYDPESLAFLGEGLRRNRLNKDREQSIRQTLLDRYYLGTGETDVVVPSKESYLEFCQRYYRPEMMILAVSGSARSEQVLSELVELMSSRQPAEVLKPADSDRGQPGQSGEFAYHHLRGDIEKPLILIGYPVPGLGHRDYLAVKLLGYALGEGKSALLNSSHDDEASNSYLAEVALVRRPAGELFLVSVVSEPDAIDKAEVRVLALIEALKKTDLPGVVLNRAKALLLTDYYNSLSPLDQRACSLVFAEAAGVTANRNKIPQILEEISAEDLRTVLGRYFSQERLTIVEFVPTTAEERTFSEEAFREVLNILVPGEIGNQNSLIEVFRSETEQPDFRPPKFRPSYSEGDLKRTSILRGPEIYVKEEHSLPLVHLGFFFPGGRISEVGSNAGITSLMLEALLRNYIRRSGLLAASQLEALGVRLSPVVQPDFFGVQASLLSSELNEGIWELIRWLRMPEIEEDDVKWARAELLRKITLQPTRKMIDSGRKAVYGDHPYGFTIEQIRENVETLGMDSVKAWKEKFLDGVNPHILALGDVQGTAFIGDLVSELSDRRYRVGTVVENDVPFPDDPEESYKVISNAEQGTAMMAFPGPEEGSDFAEMLDVALQVLGGANGLLTKSVMKELRLANDLRLFRESSLGGGAIFIEVKAAASNLEKSIQEIRRELNQFAEKLVPEPLFLSSLVTRITEHHFRRQKRADYCLEIMRSVLAGEPVDYGERYVLNVRQLRVGEVVLAVQRYMGEEE